MRATVHSIVFLVFASVLAPAASAQTAQPPSQMPATVTPSPQEATPAQPPAPTLPAAQPAVPPIPVAATQTIANPYGFSALWQGGDFVARGTLVMLLIMSMGSWYVIITKFIEQAGAGASGARRRARVLARPQHSAKAPRNSAGTARSAGWSRTGSAPPNRAKARSPTRSTRNPGSRCRCSIPPTRSATACSAAWRFSRRSARPRRSSGCSARSGVSITP